MRHNPRTLTLVLYITFALSLLSVASANDRRSHAHLNRILKKRLPQDEPDNLVDLPPLIGAQDGPSSSSATAEESSTSSSVLISVSESSSTVSETSASTTSSESAESSTSALPSTSESSTESSTSSTTTSSEIPVETTPTPEPTPDAAEVITSVVAGEIVTMTTAVGAEETQSTAEKIAATSTEPSNVVTTVLIAVGASIGGIVILWTVFRKWKLSRSTKVDQRMQPIDWQPTGYNDMLPGEHRRHSGSSFHSYSNHGHNSDDGHSSHGHGRNAAAIPEHDFTAGPSHLTPVGGYADLSRGPSPQPQMQEMSTGASHGGQYNTQVPLHHQAGYNNSQDPFNHRF